MRSTRQTASITVGAVLATIVSVLAVPLPARAVSINACLAGKLSDVGKAVAVRTTCYARDAAKPDAVLRAACLARAARRFDGGVEPAAGQFARRERRSSCLTTGDQNALANDVASYVDALAAAVGNGGSSNKCDASTLACVGRHAAALAACLSRAAQSIGAIDVACLGKQRTRLLDPIRGCLRRAEGRGLCSVPGQGAALATAAEAFAADTLCALDPSGAAPCPGLPTPVPTPTRTATPIATRTPTPVPTGDPNDVAQLCVDTINAYRASIGRPPYARWVAAETCADDQGFADSQSHVPHSAFGQCGEWAQNECPGWPGPPEDMIGTCLQMMWNEGPGADFSKHGHYINMASASYTKVACGFAVLPNGTVWAVQDFQ